MLADIDKRDARRHAMLSTNFVDGAPVWVDLGTPDVARAAGFYGSVFGWQFESAGPEAGGYGMVTQGGIMPLGPEMAAAGATTGWRLYFEVADCDAAEAAVTANGGTVVVPASDV